MLYEIVPLKNRTWTNLQCLNFAKFVIYCWENKTVRVICTTMSGVYWFKQHPTLQTWSDLHFCCLQRMCTFEIDPNNTINMIVLSAVVVFAIQIRSYAGVIPPGTIMSNCTATWVSIIITIPCWKFFPAVISKTVS